MLRQVLFLTFFGLLRKVMGETKGLEMLQMHTCTCAYTHPYGTHKDVDLFSLLSFLPCV